MSTVLETRIRDYIEPSLAAMGFALVRVKLRDGGRRPALEIMAERADETPMSLDDCTLISDTVSLRLDVENPITGAYDLEVSSPGLDRPLASATDFKRFLGREAKVEVSMPINGRRRFRGLIQAVEGENITLVLEDGTTQTIAVHAVKSAKLIPENPFKQSKKPIKETQEN